MNVNIPSFSVTINGSPQLICFGANNATLNANVSGGSGAYTYSWSQSSSSSSIITGVGAGNYTLLVTDVVHNCNFTQSVSVNQANALGLQVTVNNTNTCQGNPIQMQAFPSGGTNPYNYVWLPLNLTTSQISANLATGNYIYTIQVIDGLNCSISNTVAFVINPNPTLTISQTSICLNTVGVLTASGANTYSWQPGNIISNTVSVSSNNNFTVTGENLFTCKSTQTAQAFVFPAAMATASNNSSVCQGQTANFFSSNASNYSWKGPNGFVSSIANPQIQNCQQPQIGTYTLTITDANNCKDSTQINLLINATPNVWINSNTTLTCIGQMVTLTGIGANTYVWSNGSKLNSIVITPTISTVMMVTGTNTLTNCNATSSIMINIQKCNGTGIDESLMGHHYSRIYPNPNNGSFIISTNESGRYTLINAIGQLTAKGDIIPGENYVQKDHLAKGLYFIKLEIQSRFEMRQIIIE